MRALPNLLTASRLAAAPALAVLLLWAQQVSFNAAPEAAPILWGAAALFALAALTDLFDGQLARRLDAVTPLGAALDHAADKTLMAAGLMAYAIAWAPIDLVAAGLVIVLRDIAVAGLREGLALSSRALPVAGLGKAKTLLEMLGLGAALVSLPVGLASEASVAGSPAALAHAILEALARLGLWAAAVLALITLGLYWTKALSDQTSPTAGRGPSS